MIRKIVLLYWINFLLLWFRWGLYWLIVYCAHVLNCVASLSQSSPPKGVYTNKKKVGIEHGHATWFFSFCIEIQRMWKTIIIIILIWSFMNGHLGFPIHFHLGDCKSDSNKKFTRVIFMRYFDFRAKFRMEEYVALTLISDCNHDHKN